MQNTTHMFATIVAFGTACAAPKRSFRENAAAEDNEPALKRAGRIVIALQVID